MSQWQQKVSAGDRLRGIPAGMYNTVVDLVTPGAKPPGDTVQDRNRPYHWIKVRNDTDVNKSLGEAIGFDGPALTLGNRDEYLRQRHAIVWQGITNDTLGDEQGNYGLWERVDKHTGESFNETNYRYAYDNWGFCLEPIRIGHVGRVAVSGVILAPIWVTHPAHLYVRAGEDKRNDNYAESDFHGSGKILWMSPEPAKGLTTEVLTSNEYHELRLALIQLGHHECPSYPCTLSADITAMDTTSDPPAPGKGLVRPMRRGFPADSPRVLTDEDMHFYHFDWNADRASFKHVWAYNYSEQFLPRDIRATITWDRSSRIWRIEPPPINVPYLVSSFGHLSGVLLWSLEYDHPASVVGLSRSSSGIFTALRDVRLDIEMVAYAHRTDGTAPFECSCILQDDAGGSFSDHDWAFNEIANNFNARRPLSMTTLIDLQEGDQMRFLLSPVDASAGQPEVDVNVARLKIRLAH